MLVVSEIYIVENGHGREEMKEMRGKVELQKEKLSAVKK